MSDTTTRTVPVEDVIPYEVNNDPARLAHLVRPSDNGHDDPTDPITAQDVVDLARATQTPVLAACGVEFVPLRNPTGLRVCDPCLDIAHAAITGGER